MAFDAENKSGTKTCGHKHRTEEAAQKCVDGKKFTAVGGYKRVKPKSRATRCGEACGALEEASNIVEEVVSELREIADKNEIPTLIELDPVRDAFLAPFKARIDDADGKRESAKDELESLKEEIEEWRDNLPESLQSSQKYDDLESCATTLDDALNEGAEEEAPDAPKEITPDSLRSWCDDLHEWAEKMNGIGDSANEAEFPGMYG